jgi:transposase-like protein/transposase InsO family protein
MRVEVLGGVERRRRWSHDDKTRIIEETLAPGAKVTEVARRNGSAARYCRIMRDLCRLIGWTVVDLFRSRATLEAEIWALRQQINVLRRTAPTKHAFSAIDRLIFVGLYWLFPKIREALAIVKPETVVRWHRAGFRSYWRWKSRARGGRPTVALEIRELIREMSIANPLWGAPRIHGELLKLGIEIGQTSVAKYTARRRGPPSQGWKTFLRNHADGIAAMDLFVVPTISFRLLYGLLIMGHGRRQVLWFGVTAHPTAEWIANQITQACGWKQAPRYLIRDRDGAYGEVFIRRVRSMGIRDRPTSPRSPWQNAYAERLIGSIRRECLDHVVVFGERHLRHVLLSYMNYYNETRTHLSLDKDAPLSRTVQRAGRILRLPILGGLHHQYIRI